MRHFSINEKGCLCLSKHESKHQHVDQKFSQQCGRESEWDRISHRLEALRHIFKTFHEPYRIFYVDSVSEAILEVSREIFSTFCGLFFFYLLNNAMYRRDFGRLSR